MTSRDQAIKIAEQYFDDDSFVNDLTQLVAVETESQNPDKRAELYRYLNDHITPMLTKLGFTSEVFENPIVTGGPILVGSRIEDTSLPTIFTYGHGDVIHGQNSQWRKGLHPFKVRIEDDKIYGRGTADNKCQHLINLSAMAFVIAQKGKLGFNVKIVVETSEETGSLGLREFFEINKTLLAADILIASDGPRLAPETPTLFMGTRGGINFDLEVNLRDGSNHSGNWGGLLADPAIILCHAISTITDARGQINIADWRPNSFTPNISKALKGLPIKGGPQISDNWGEQGLDPAERAFGWNSFAVLAMHSGVPENPVNAIAGNASAHCQLRFVVGTDVDNIIPALRKHLDHQGFAQVTIKPSKNLCFKATRMDLDHPWVEFTARSITKTCGKQPHLLPNLAGSLPNDAFSEILGLTTIWIPHSYGGCSQHAPNEHILKPIARDALRNMTGLFWDIGDNPPQ